MRLTRWTCGKKDKNIKIKNGFMPKKNGGINMEVSRVKRWDSLRNNISFRTNNKLNSRDECFENMIKCGKEVKKLFNLNDKDIYDLLKR